MNFPRVYTFKNYVWIEGMINAIFFLGTMESFKFRGVNIHGLARSYFFSGMSILLIRFSVY